MQKLAFIGLGIMGAPMCRNLLKAGFTVTVFNRTAKKMESLAAQGANTANSPAEAAKEADIIITIVSDTPDVEAVILGDDGVIHGAKSGAIIIDMSTISPSATQEIATKLSGKQIDMLDAPVSGGDTGAIAATLSIMVGGRPEVFEKAKPVLEAMGKTITHVGGNGMGQTVKLCNQILVTVTNLAVSEAVCFAKKAGVDPAKMIEATSGGAAGSWQLANLGSKMVQRDFAPGFMVDLQQKDLRLAIEAAQKMQLPLPALHLVSQLFAGCQAHGEGREGTQALVKSIERLAGIQER